MPSHLLLTYEPIWTVILPLIKTQDIIKGEYNYDTPTSIIDITGKCSNLTTEDQLPEGIELMEYPINQQRTLPNSSILPIPTIHPLAAPPSHCSCILIDICIPNISNSHRLTVNFEAPREMNMKRNLGFSPVRLKRQKESNVLGIAQACYLIPLLFEKEYNGENQVADKRRCKRIDKMRIETEAQKEELLEALNSCFLGIDSKVL